MRTYAIFHTQARVHVDNETAKNKQAAVKKFCERTGREHSYHWRAMTKRDMEKFYAA